MKVAQTNRFWGIIIASIGICGAILTWKPAIKQGNLVRLFALLIAVALAGLLILITNKSYSQLVDKWREIPKLTQFIIALILCVVLYFGILIFGVVLTQLY